MKGGVRGGDCIDINELRTVLSRSSPLVSENRRNKYRDKGRGFVLLGVVCRPRVVTDDLLTYLLTLLS